MTYDFIPKLSTQAGACLTVENWEQVGVDMASFALSALLMKPGMELLKTLPNLAAYVGWQKTLVLNASLSLKSMDDVYVLRSSYDGSRSQYTRNELLALIIQLAPQMVILPQGFCRTDETLWLSLPESIFPFFPINECPDYEGQKQYGVYIEFDGVVTDALQDQLQSHPHHLKYVIGDMSPAVLQDLVMLGARYLESDKPANDAYQGLIYYQEGVIAIQDASEALEFSAIDPLCECPTCQQQLTRAYLHHLYEHTSLLCYRFLIQHNILYTHHLPQLEISI
ncbi:MAG: queuine tRNA-ribosyltransferase [Legionellaceae bacterium]|nr:queuine tRNA-ribosyltransferase [Legionellaceae bacterium]